MIPVNSRVDAVKRFGGRETLRQVVMEGVGLMAS